MIDPMTDIDDGAAIRPQWSESAEQAVLGAVMLDNAAIDQIGNLRRSHFYDGRHAAIFDAITSLVATRRVADVITVHEVLLDRGLAGDCGGLVYLNQLNACVHSAAPARRHAAIVREHAHQRALLGAAGKAVEVARGVGPVAEKLDLIGQLFSQLQGAVVARQPRRLAEIALERTAYYEALQEGRVQPGWRTHIPWLNGMLNGGLRPGTLYILAARPSIGKSSLAADLAFNLAGDDLPSLFLSQEMPDTDLADRAIANSGRVDLGTLLTGRMTPDDWTRASEGVELISSRPLFVDDQPSLTLRDIRAKVRAVPGLKVLFLDYLQLCASTRKDGNRTLEIGEVSRELKTLAKEAGIAVVALSQLNREVEHRANKRPTLADLRESGGIEQDADVVVLLWPVRDLKAEGRKIVGCDVAKNRQGRTGEHGLDFFVGTQRWAESTADITPRPAKDNL